MNHLLPIKIMLWLAGISFTACVCLFVYGYFIEKPYLRYQNLPFPPLRQQIHAGDVVTLSVERCNDSDQKQTYITSHAIHNEGTKVLVLLPPVSVDIEAGCHRANSQVNHSPADTKPGIYTFQGTATVPGLLRMFNVHWYSESFEVVNP